MVNGSVTVLQVFPYSRNRSDHHLMTFNFG